MQPHFCQTSHKNAIPSSGTSTGSTPSQLYVVVAYDGNDEKVGTDAENKTVTIFQLSYSRIERFSYDLEKWFR